MKLHLPLGLYKALCACFAAVVSIGTASLADMITPDGRTNTSVVQNGSTYDVYTGTVRGNTGFNSFHTFDVYEGTTANLHLSQGTANLINVIRDKMTNIDGVLNAYKDGRIGGNVFMLNSNGIVVGPGGVVNAGSITMSTPTAHFIEQLIARDGGISDAATQAVLAGDMPINPDGLVSIKGRINAVNDVAVKSGSAEIAGKIRTGVRTEEIANTGGRNIDNKNISIEGGRLSIGAPSSKKSGMLASAGSGNSSQNREGNGSITVETVKDIRLAGTAVLDTSSTGNAGDVTLKAGRDFTAQKGAVVNASSSGDGTGGSVTVCAKGSINLDGAVVDVGSANGSSGLIYMDPDTVNITSESQLTGNVQIEARVINVDGFTWTGDSFTLNAGNVFGSEIYEGDVSVNIRNSNLDSGQFSITATATLGNASAYILIDGQSSLSGGNMTLKSSSGTGNAGIDILGCLTGDSITVEASSSLLAAGVSVNGSVTGNIVNIKSAGTTSADVMIGSGALVKALKANDQGNGINIMTALAGDSKWEKAVNGVIDIKGRLEIGRADGDEDNLGDIDIKSAGNISVADGAVISAPSGNDFEAGSIELTAKGSVSIGAATLDVHGPAALADGIGSGGLISINGGQSVVIKGATMNVSTNFAGISGMIKVTAPNLELGSMTLSGNASFLGCNVLIKDATITNTAGYSLGLTAAGDGWDTPFKNDLTLSVIGSSISADILNLAIDSKINADDYVKYDEASDQFIVIGMPEMFDRDAILEVDAGSRLTGVYQVSITAENDYGDSIIRLNGDVNAGSPLLAGQTAPLIAQSLVIKAAASGDALIQMGQGHYTSVFDTLVSAKSLDGTARITIGTADSSAMIESADMTLTAFSGLNADIQILGTSKVTGSTIGIYTHSSGETIHTGSERSSTITVGEGATITADADGAMDVADVALMSTFAVHDPSTPDDGISTAPVTARIDMNGTINVNAGQDRGEVIIYSQGDIVMGDRGSVNTAYGDPEGELSGSLMLQAENSLIQNSGDFATGFVNLGANSVEINSSHTYDSDTVIEGTSISIGNGVILDAKNHSLKLIVNRTSGNAHITIGNDCTFSAGTIDIYAEGYGVLNYINLWGSSSIEIGNNFHATALTGDINISSQGIGSSQVRFGSNVLLDAAGSINVSATVTHGYSVDFSYTTPLVGGLSVNIVETLKIAKGIYDKIKKIQDPGGPRGNGSLFMGAVAIGVSDAHISFADSDKSVLNARNGSVSIEASSTAKDASFVSLTGQSINVGVGVGLFDTSVTFGKNVHVEAKNDISIKSTNISSINGMMNGKSDNKNKLQSCISLVVGYSRVNNTISFDASDYFKAGGKIDIGAYTNYSLSASAGAASQQGSLGSVGIGVATVFQKTSITAPCSFEAGGDFKMVSNVEGEVSTMSSGSVSYKKNKEKPQNYTESNTMAVVKAIFKVFYVPWVDKIVGAVEDSEIKKKWDELGGDPNIGKDAAGIERNGLAGAGALTVQVARTSSSVNFSGNLISGGNADIKATNKVDYLSSAKSTIDQAAAKYVGAFAVNWSDNETTATATIGSGSEIDCAGKLSLNSSVDLPGRKNFLNWEKIYDFFAEKKYSIEGFENAFKLVFNSLVNWEKAYDSGSLGVQKAFFNSWTSTGNTTHQKVKDPDSGGALSVNLNVANFKQTSKATIEDGVKINQRHLTATPGSVDVSSTISGTLLNFTGACPLNFNYEGWKDFQNEWNPQQNLLMPNDPVAAGIGAAVGVYLYDNNCRASIGAATIDAQSISVKADNSMVGLSVATSGGSAVKGGAEGNFSMLNVNNATNAWIAGGAGITIKSAGSDGGLRILANDSSTMINLAGEVFSSNGVSIGVGVAFTRVVSATQAVCGTIDHSSFSADVLSLYEDDMDLLAPAADAGMAPGSFTITGPIDITATNGTTFVSVGIAGTKAYPSGEAGASNYGVAVSANVGVNLYDGTTNATMRNVNLLGQSGANLTLSARNSATIIAVGGALAIELKSKGAAVGGTFTWNQVDNNANALMDNVQCLDGALIGDVKVEAKNDALIVSAGVGVAVAKVGAAGKSVSVAAAASVNRSKNNAHATISNSSLNARGLSLLAEGNSNAYAVGVAASVSGIAVGAVVSVNTIANETISLIDNSTLTLGGNADVNAKSAGGGLGVAVGGSVAYSVAEASFGVGVNAVATHIDIGNTTKAAITGNNTVLTLGGGLNLLATDESAFSFYNIGLALAPTVGIGAAYTMVNINNNVEALLQGARVSANGDIYIKSLENAYAFQLEIAGSGSSKVGVAGGVAIVNIGNKVSTTIRDAQIETKGKLTADSENTNESYLFFADASGTGKVGIGGEVGVLTLHNTANTVLDHSIVAAFAGTDLRSVAKDEAKSFGGTVGVGGALGIGASIITTVFHSGSDIEVADSNIGNVMKNGIVALAKNGGGFSANSSTLSSNTTGVGAAAVGISAAGVAASVSVTTFSDYARAHIKNSRIEVQGNIDVVSSLKHSQDMAAISAGISSLVGIAGNVGVNYASSTSESIVEGSELSSRGDVNVLAGTTTIFGDGSYMILGSAGVGTVGLGGNVGVNYINTETRAIIKNSDVKASGGGTVKSDNVSSIWSFMGAGAGSGTFSLATTIGVNNISGQSSAMIIADDGQRHFVTAGSLSVLANSEARFTNILTTADGSAGGAIGAAVAYNGSKASTTAAIIGNLDLDVVNALQVHAVNTRYGKDIVNSVGFGGAFALHGSVSIYNFDAALPSDTLKYIQSGDQSIFTSANDNLATIDRLVGDSTGLSGSVPGSLPETGSLPAGTSAYIDLNGNDLLAGSIDVRADEKTSIFQESGAVSVGGYAGVGASVSYAGLSSKALAYIDHARIYTPGNLNVLATHTVSESDVWAISGSGAIYLGAAGAFATYAEDANLHAYLGSGTIVNKANDITIKSIDDVNVKATVGAADVSMISSGISHASVGQTGSVKAGLQDGAMIGQAVGGKVGNLTIAAEELGKLISNAYAFGVGAVFVDYSRAHAFSKMHLNAYIGNNSQLTVAGAVNLATTGNYHIETRTVGANIGAGGTGLIFSDGEIDLDDLVSVGNNVSIQARDIDILASGSSFIDAYSKPVGAGAAQAEYSKSIAVTRGSVNTRLGDNVSLTAMHAIGIGAEYNSSEKAYNGNFQLALVSLSPTDSTARSDVHAATVIGGGFTARASVLLDIHARTSSHIEAFNNTLYGGLLNVEVAQSVNGQESSKALVSIAGGQDSSLLEADNISINSSTNTWIDTKSDENNVGLVFTYGGARNELTYSADATLRVDGKVDMRANKALLNASNTVVKPESSKAIDFDGGGLVNVPYLKSTTKYSQTALVSLSKGTTINCMGKDGLPFSISAVNTIKTYDNIYSSSGGLAGCASTTVTTDYNGKADVKIEGSTLSSSGDASIVADTFVEMTAKTDSVSGGFAMGMSDDITMMLNIHNGVLIGEDSTIKSQRNLTIAAGKNTGNTVNAIVRQNSYSAIPYLEGGFAKASLSLDNGIIMKERSYVVGYGEVTITSGKLDDTFKVGTEYTAKGYTSNTDWNKNITLSGKSSLAVDGMLIAGNYDTTEIWIDADGLVYRKQYRKDENGNPILQDAQGNRINYDRGLVIAESNGSRTLVLADGTRIKNVYAVYDNVLDTNNTWHTVSSSDAGASLWAKIQTLKTISGNASLDQQARLEADTQIAVLVGELQALGKWDAVNNIYKPGDQSAIEIKDMNITTGSMNITAGSVEGSGAIAVTGGSIINITSDYAGSLIVDKIGFSDSAPGWLTLNGTRQSNISAPSGFKGTWTTSAGFAFGDGVTITSTHGNSLVMLNGDITNKYGKVTVNSAGSIFSQGTVTASEISLTAAGSLIQNSDKYLYFLTNPDFQKQLADMEAGRIKDFLNGLSHYGQGNFSESTSGNNALTDSTTGSAFLASGSIFINANYVCLNGTVRSGTQDHTLTVDDTTRVFANNTQMTLDEATAWWKQNQNQSSVFNVVGTVGNSSATFNAATGEIEVANIKSTGGRIEIYGSLLNISDSRGSIEALDGFSNLNITNNMNYTLVMNSADLAQSVSGVIKLVDTAKPIYLDGGGINGFETTVYTRVWNADHTAANVVVYSNVAGSTSGISGFEQVASGSVSNSAVNWNGAVYAATIYDDYQSIGANGTMSAGGYDPSKGLQLVEQVKYTGEYHYRHHSTASDQHSYSFHNDRTIVQLAKGEDMIVSQGGDAANKGVMSQYDMEFAFNSGKSDINSNPFSYDEYYYDMTATVTHRIKADYNIGVNFIGHADSSASVKSTGNVVFRGDVSTTKMIDVNTAGEMEGTGSLSSSVINLQANGNIGAQGALNINQGDGGYTNASSLAGNVNLQSLTGSLHIGRMSASQGNVNLNAAGDVVGRNAQSVIEAKGIRIVSGGEVYGYDDDGGKASLHVRGVADGQGKRSSIVDIDASGSVALKGTGDLGLKTIRSRNGSVTIDVWGGDLFDATKNEYFNPSINEDTNNEWHTNGLIAYGGEALDNRVHEFENAMNNAYQDYMSTDKDGNYVYRDAEGRYRTPEAKRQLLAQSYTDTAAQQLKAGKLAESDMVIGLACQTNAADAGILLSGDTANEAYRATYDKYLGLLGSCSDQQKAGAAAEYRIASNEYGVNVRLASNSFAEGAYTATSEDRTRLSVGMGYTEFGLSHSFNAQIGGLVAGGGGPAGVFIDDLVNISALKGNVDVTVHEGGMGDRTLYGNLNVNDMENWSQADWDTLATLNQREVSLGNDGTLTIKPNRSIMIEALSAQVKAQDDVALSLSASSHVQSSVASASGSVALGLGSGDMSFSSLNAGGSLSIDQTHGGLSTNLNVDHLSSSSLAVTLEGGNIGMGIEGDLAIDSINTSGNVVLMASGSIWGASPDASINAGSGNVTLQAGGSVGTQANPLDVNTAGSIHVGYGSGGGFVDGLPGSSITTTPGRTEENGSSSRTYSPAASQIAVISTLQTPPAVLSLSSFYANTVAPQQSAGDREEPSLIDMSLMPTPDEEPDIDLTQLILQ